MRRGRDVKILKDSKENPIGISLGADFTAEHEWGIKKIQRTFGLNVDAVGHERYLATKALSEDFYKIFDVKYRKENYKILIVRDSVYSYYTENSPKLGDHILAELDSFKEEITAAWCDGSFSIRWPNDGSVESKFIEETLVPAIISGKIYIGLFGGMPAFGNAGLTIILRDKLPEDVKDYWKQNHLDAIKLQKASDKTGIVQKINKLNEKSDGWRKPFGYYALRSSWSRPIFKTKHPVIYWLNPQNQDSVNCGWFTVEELEQWLKGEGPIPK